MIAFTPSSGFLWAWALFLLFVAVVVVPIVALLLIRLIVAVNTLNTTARAADKAARPVGVNVKPIPELARTLQLIKEVTKVARVADEHGVLLEQGLTREIPAPRY